MATFFSAYVGGLLRVFAWPEFGLLLVGVLIGAIVGILPGLGGAATVALLMPFIVGLDPARAFALLMGVAAVTATTGDLTSILIGVPGEATTAATVVDGHPMARRGEAPRAIGASLASSLAGTLFGALTLTFTMPLAGVLIRSIGSPELFMLALFGVTFMAPLSGASRLKGLAAGGLGLMLAMVGLDQLGATPRFTFGQLTLWDGIGAIPVVLGLFAIPEIVELAGSRVSPLTTDDWGHATRKGLAQGVRDAVRLRSLVLRSSAIGAVMGLLPGIGASISQWMAYADAARRSKRPSEFGHGAIEGVIAPSAANNATLGGALTPTLALGVPGSLTSAMLLSALVLLGLAPGPRLLLPERDGGHLTLVFALVWFMVIGNIVAVGVSYAASGLLVRITQVRAERLVPFLLVVTFFGAFMERQAVADVLVTCVMGALGLALVRYDWPRAPVLLGLVLGPLAENRLFLSMDAFGTSWLLRPGVLIVGALILGSLLLPGRARASSEGELPAGRRPTAPMYRDELIFGILLVVLLISAIVAATSYPPRASLMPKLVATVTAALLMTAFALDVRSPRWSERPEWAADISFENPVARWLPVFLVLTWAVGFVLSAPLLIFGYLVAGGERPLRAVLMAVGVLLVVNVILTGWLGVSFPPGALTTWASGQP